MTVRTAKEHEYQERFQVPIGEELAWVEVVSIKNKIYAVELPAREPLFITQIKNKDNENCWVSIPQGDDDIAGIIGEFISSRTKKKET